MFSDTKLVGNFSNWAAHYQTRFPFFLIVPGFTLFQEGFENPEEAVEVPPEVEYEDQLEYDPNQEETVQYDDYNYDDEQEEY